MSWLSDVLGDTWEHFEDAWKAFWQEIFDIPELPETDRVYNTISEGIPVARCYGTCKIGGNKLRMNDPSDSDYRVIVGHCLGEVEGITDVYVNDVVWADLKGTPTKTEYTGTRTQTADARFSDKASAYRGMAYTAFTFGKGDKVVKQIGHDPNIVVVMEGLKCAPLAGGGDVFTRNPAVILYDWYLNVEGYSAGDLSLLDFQSLEELCDEVPSGGTLPRYRFDYNIGTNMTINDAKKLIWQSFNGRVVMSQGKLKPVWDSSQMADGAGSLTAKTVSHAFTEDDIVKDSISWKQPDRANVVRVHYRDSSEEYKSSSVEEKNDDDIADVGEILYEDKSWFVTNAELARRRAKYRFNKFKYEDYDCKFSAYSGAGDLEVYDLVTVTHSLPGWTAKQFIVIAKGEDAYGRMRFTLRAYYSGIYDDSEVGDQSGYASDLPNPYATPNPSTSISLSVVSLGSEHDYSAVNVSFTPPTDSFYSYTEIYVSNDDATYVLAGTSSGEDYVINGMGTIYQPGDTVYVKLVNVNEMGVPEEMPVAADDSVVVTGYIRFGSYYVGQYDLWGGNAAIGNAATVVVVGNLDGTPKIALGPTADAITYAGTQSGFYVDGDGYMRVGSDTHGLKFDPSSGVLDVPTKVKVGSGSPYIDIDGANARIRSSDYATGIAGAGFTLQPDLLEVGNIAARGILRSAVFQKSVIHAVGGYLAVMPADVLASDMSALDLATMDIEDNETFSVGDFLRIRDGIDDEWLEVTSVDSDLTYHVTRDKAGVYGADSNPAWKKGATVVNFQASGGGLVFIDGITKRIGFYSHAGTPWTTLTEHVRIGNLNAFLDYSSEIYGFAAGTSTEYIKVDPTNGIRISSAGANALTIKSGGDITIEDGGDLNIEAGGDIRFEGSAYTISINTTVTGNVMYFLPTGGSSTSLALGGPAGGSAGFGSVYAYASGSAGLDVIEDAQNRMAVIASRASGSSDVTMTFQDENVTKAVKFLYENGGNQYFGPDEDGEWDIGRDSYRWATGYFDDIEVTNGVTLESYDTGWIARSDWTNVHIGSSTTKNLDSNVNHGLGAPLSDLLVIILASTSGTDATSWVIDNHQRANSYGINTYGVDDDNITVQTGTAGVGYIDTDGTPEFLVADDIYYKVKVYKLT